MMEINWVLLILKEIFTREFWLHYLIFLHSIKLIIIIIEVFVLLGIAVSIIPAVAKAVLKFTIYCLFFKIIFIDQGLIFFIIINVCISVVLIFWKGEGLWAASLMLIVAFVIKIFIWVIRIVIELAFCNFHVWIWRLSEVLFLRLLRVLFALFLTFYFSSWRIFLFWFFVF